jgi:hypothetical protein
MTALGALATTIGAVIDDLDALRALMSASGDRAARNAYDWAERGYPSAVGASDGPRGGESWCETHEVGPDRCDPAQRHLCRIVSLPASGDRLSDLVGRVDDAARSAQAMWATGHDLRRQLDHARQLTQRMLTAVEDCAGLRAPAPPTLNEHAEVCVNHKRAGFDAEPGRKRRLDQGILCDWCIGHLRDLGQLPPKAIVEAHERGDKTVVQRWTSPLRKAAEATTAPRTGKRGWSNERNNPPRPVVNADGTTTRGAYAGDLAERWAKDGPLR